jgi:hypothetical protein
MEPMTMLAIGSAVAGGIQSIMGGQAQGAAIRAQNEEAYRNWIASNSQVTMNNARQHFQTAYQFAEQAKRNTAIAQAAYEYQYEAKQALRDQSSFQQKQLSNQLFSQRSSLLNAIGSKGISPTSGMYGALATAQAINSISSAVQLEKNRLQQMINIDKQTKGMLSQQTSNVFMPNIQGYSDAPTFGNPSAAEAGGFLSGIVQIGGAIGAAAMPTQTPGNNTTTPTSNNQLPTMAINGTLT